MNKKVIDYIEILKRAQDNKKQVELLNFMALLSQMDNLDLIGFAVFLSVPLAAMDSDGVRQTRPFEDVFSDMIDEFLKTSDSYRLQIIKMAEEIVNAEADNIK